MAEDRPSGSDIPSRIGRAMLFAAWVVGLALLVLLFQRFMDWGENPNPDLALNLDSQGRAQVVLARNRAGHYVASGRINGEPVVFMIDTGATDVALPLDLARRLDLRLGAARIARTVQRLINVGLSSRLRLPMSDLQFEADLAVAQLRKSLDAFARLDVAQALEVLKQDDAIDQEFDGLLRKLITYMMEDPRTISSSIDLVFVAKAIERIGDHAKNLAEATIYVVKGTDVRHHTLEDVENVVR